MRKAILSILFFALLTSIQAQVVAVRQVVATAGKDTLIGPTIWAYTIGEPVVDTYTSGSLVFTQGFHQPDGYSITPFVPPVSNLVIYPNPAKPNATLSFYLKVDKPSLSLVIYDAQGKVYLKQTLSSYAGQTYHSLNPQIMAAGTYTVKVFIGSDVYSGRYVVTNQ